MQKPYLTKYGKPEHSTKSFFRNKKSTGPKNDRKCITPEAYEVLNLYEKQNLL